MDTLTWVMVGATVVGWGGAIYVEFGSVFFLVAGLGWLFWKGMDHTNSSGSAAGKVSAYAAFNANQQALPGTISASEWDASIRAGGVASMSVPPPSSSASSLPSSFPSSSSSSSSSASSLPSASSFSGGNTLGSGLQPANSVLAAAAAERRARERGGGGGRGEGETVRPRKKSYVYGIA